MTNSLEIMFWTLEKFNTIRIDLLFRPINSVTILDQIGAQGVKNLLIYLITEHFGVGNGRLYSRDSFVITATQPREFSQRMTRVQRIGRTFECLPLVQRSLIGLFSLAVALEVH